MDRLPFLSTFICIYQFTCKWQRKDIGKIERRVNIRISKQVPKNLKLRRGTALNRTIAWHLIDTGHTIDIPQSFQIIGGQKHSLLGKNKETHT